MSNFQPQSRREARNLQPQRKVVVVRRAPQKPKKGGASKVLSLLALFAIGGLLVGTSLPVEAFSSPSQAAANVDTVETDVVVDDQSLAVSDSAIAADTKRSDYKITSYQELMTERYGNLSYLYSVGTGDIQWPFPYVVPISSGYGGRAAPCATCSTFHTGIDFVPGFETPIYAIATGKISYLANEGGFGYHMIVDSDVDGKKFQTLYAHMKDKSSKYKVGQTIEVGEQLGLVGATGQVTAPHLHLEIHIDGVPIDPFPWLKRYAAK
jgi:murein DD-endopeptidase MepM/ murein hydrolase activator NlpD